MKYFLDEFLGKGNKENASKHQTYPIGSEDDEENKSIDKWIKNYNWIEEWLDTWIESNTTQKWREDESWIGKDEEEEEDPDNSIYIYLPSEGRQPFTRWRWSFPKSSQLKVKAKTFSIKYEKELSSMDKIILKSFQKKYLYHAIDDIVCLLKSKPIERDNLLAILYSPVLSLQNHFSIDFFDIWIDEISISKSSKANKFLTTKNSNFQPFRYITIRLLYTNKRLPKKTESFW